MIVSAVQFSTKGVKDIRGKTLSLIQQAHAFSNCYALVCSNRSGTEDGIEFLGNSFICNHKGKILEAAEERGDQIISCEIDIGEIRKTKKELAFYRDRRTDLYGALSRED